MKKNYLLKIMAIVICVLLVGCESQNEVGEKKPTNVSSENISNISMKAEIEEQVIADRKNVKITAKSINYDNRMGLEIKLLIENNSNENIAVDAVKLSINDIMLTSSLYENVAPNKKANASIRIDSSEFELSKITEIKDIEFTIDVFNSDTWEDIFTEENIKIETNITNYTQKYNTEGSLVYNEKDIKIYVLKMSDEKSFFGSDVYVYIENNSSKNITIEAEDVSVNGFMIDPAFMSDIGAGKKAYTLMSFMKSDLEENDISNITSIELKFSGYDYNTWKDIFETEVLTINF